MSDKVWFVSVDRAQLDGQFSSEEVCGLRAERPQSSFLVWKEGMAQWEDADGFPELSPAPAPPQPGPPPVAADEAPAPPAYAVSSATRPQVGTQALQEAGVLKGLLNPSFEQFVTPKIMKILYIIVMVLIGLGVVAGIVMGFISIINAFRWNQFGMAFVGLFQIVLAPVFGMLYLAFLRMLFEIAMVLFKIRENTAAIVTGMEKGGEETE